jgi:hypothetical protein
LMLTMGQSRSAESGPELKLLLERFPILLIGRIFNGDCVVTLADFATFLHFSLALLRQCHILEYP